ncbi:hypothetical protein HQ47_06240 [Porphyromonas macacae]|uniref:Peptidyl-prolyl cis-trans isomerase n=1 Tax=Porphyromonas macacae TaxID=28115 RepID=A0A0A2E8A5_9PORP|nr:FKBP-type peptidyl-prolyl cis-trans isomerase [Porphyromonas macacae]KGN73842.1 hypothetical protein HQ47_06240 [Porphyromonas macacae]
MNSRTKFLQLLLAFFVLLGFASCNDKINTEEQNRLNSERAFREYKGNAEYKAITMDGLIGDKYVYAKWLKEGKTNQKPIFTSRVDIHFKIYLLGEKGKHFLVYDNYSSETGERFAVYRGDSGRNVTLGMRIGLLNMEKGDEVELIVPWYMAYGQSMNMEYRIPSYSALKYVVRLDDIIPEDAQ